MEHYEGDRGEGREATLQRGHISNTGDIIGTQGTIRHVALQLQRG